MKGGACTWMVAVAVAMLVAGSQADDFSLSKYGAKADGKADDGPAIVKAWADACKAKTASKLVIPKGTYAVGPIMLEGPCGAPITIQANEATLMAPGDPSLFSKQRGWIILQNIDKLTFVGGIFNGQGQITWKKNAWKSCLGTNKCPPLPVNMNINGVNNSIFDKLTSKDSKNFHLNCIDGHNVTFKGVMISAPEESPNTDGIHIARSTDIKVLDTIIETGDDCVSMGDDLKNVLIEGVKCGPGHGISIGSLGKGTDEKDVTGITVTKSTFLNSGNGVRIKTWPSAPGTIKVTDIKFEGLTMVNVSNPVIIDQQYCPWNLCSMDKPSQIQISKLKIADIKGTSATQDVIIFACSSSKPCQDVVVGNIDLKFKGDPKLGTEATTKCQNVKYTTTGTQSPKLCEKSSAPQPPLKTAAKVSRKVAE